jgi:hypothetical protein
MANRFENISFVPIRDALLVPRDLLEQIKDLPFDIEDFYKFFGFYAESPLNFFWIVMDRENTTEPRIGIMWASVDPIPQSLSVHIVSLRKVYQGTGLFKEKIAPFFTDMKKKMKLKRGFWITSRPKAFSRMSPSFKATKLTVMEFDEKEPENG